MAIFKTTFTDKGKVDRLLYLAASNFFLAVGKETPWTSDDGSDVTEENPPTPDSSLGDLTQVVLYKKPFYQTLAVESQCGIDFDSCGESLGTKKLTLINLETTSLETLYAIAPSYLYVRVYIDQSDLDFASITSYRSVGLYKDITFNTPGAIRYLPPSVENQGVLYWYSYFTPIYRDTLVDKASVFEIIIKA